LASVTVEDAGPCKKLLKIVVPAEEMREKIESSYKKLRETVNIDGFRPGRAPRRLLERRFGEKVLEEAKETAMADASQKALEDNDLTPIGEPSFDNIDYPEDGDLSFDVSIEVKPQFDLPEYEGLRLKRMPVVVTDEDVDRSLEQIRLRRARFEPVADGAVQENDQITADWTAEIDGEQVAKESTVNIQVTGHRLGYMTVDLVEALEGSKEGETRECEGRFRDDHPVEKLQGKDARLQITVKQIRRPALPDLDDAFAKTLDFDSIEELRETVRTQLEARKQREVQQNLERQATDQLLACVDIELPEGLVKRQASDVLMRTQLRLRSEGMPEEDIDDHLAALQSESEEVSARDIKLYFLFEKIAEKEKIFVTENDLENRIAQLANSYRESAQRVRNYLEEQKALPQLRIQMREERVMEHVLKNAEIQDAKT